MLRVDYMSKLVKIIIIPPYRGAKRPNRVVNRPAGGAMNHASAYPYDPIFRAPQSEKSDRAASNGPILRIFAMLSAVARRA